MTTSSKWRPRNRAGRFLLTVLPYQISPNADATEPSHDNSTTHESPSPEAHASMSLENRPEPDGCWAGGSCREDRGEYRSGFTIFSSQWCNYRSRNPVS